MRSLVAILLVTACWEGEPAKTPPAKAADETAARTTPEPMKPPELAMATAADCAAVGDAVAKRRMDLAMSHSHADIPQEKLAAAAASKRVAEHCQNDAWSAEAAACAKHSGFEACQSTLTKDQIDELKATASPLDGMSLF